MKILKDISRAAIAICVAYTMNKIQFTIVRFIVPLCVYMRSTLYPIQYRNSEVIYLYTLLFNIVYCLIYAFVGTKRNRWYLVGGYFLILIGFYLIVLL